MCCVQELYDISFWVFWFSVQPSWCDVILKVRVSGRSLLYVRGCKVSWVLSRPSTGGGGGLRSWGGGRSCQCGEFSRNPCLLFSRYDAEACVRFF